MAGYSIPADEGYLFFGRTTATAFSDETVLPGETHTYTISAVEQEHYNFSPPATATATAPSFPARSVLPSTPPIKLPPMPKGHMAEQPHLTDTMEPAIATLSGYDPRRVGVQADGQLLGRRRTSRSTCYPGI